MDTTNSRLLATFESDFEASIFAGILERYHIPSFIRDMNRDELNVPVGRFCMYVSQNNWREARDIYETQYDEEAEKLVQIDGLNFIRRTDKKCIYCKNEGILIHEPTPLQVLANGLLNVIFLQGLLSKKYYCENCRSNWKARGC